jgi:two-component system, LytTR family, response regulator
MQRIPTLIVDDEKPSRDAIKTLLLQDPAIDIVGEAMDGETALDLITALRPRLVFLDIQMPMLGGVDMLRQLSLSGRPEVIFVTAHQKYASNAFDLYAVDYLMKPFSNERFAMALERAKRRLADTSFEGTERALKSLMDRLDGLRPPAAEPATAPPAHDRQRLIVKAGGQLHFLEQRDIRWAEAQGDYVKIHHKSRGLLVRMTMNKLEKLLDPGQFVRIHKSSIVNLSNVRRVLPILANSRGMELDNGTTLRIGGSYRAVIERIR